jgi:ribose 5-phosphate isomerase A
MTDLSRVFPGDREREKELAARASLKFVEGECVIGLGTGSTAEHVVRLLAARVKEGLKIVAIPTSVKTRDLALSLGIPIATLDEHPEIDVTIDGADELDPSLNLVKGGGGALLREKVIASASRRLVIVADSTKRVDALGAFPLPVEIIAFARALLERRIAALGAGVALRRRADGSPFTTDEGHQILDCSFGRIADPPALARTLSDMPGVVEHGLFIGMADVALVGNGDDVLELRREPARS